LISASPATTGVWCTDKFGGSTTPPVLELVVKGKRLGEILAFMAIIMMSKTRVFSSSERGLKVFQRALFAGQVLMERFPAAFGEEVSAQLVVLLAVGMPWSPAEISARTSSVPKALRFNLLKLVGDLVPLSEACSTAHAKAFIGRVEAVSALLKEAEDLNNPSLHLKVGPANPRAYVVRGSPGGDTAPIDTDGVQDENLATGDAFFELAEAGRGAASSLWNNRQLTKLPQATELSDGESGDCMEVTAPEPDSSSKRKRKSSRTDATAAKKLREETEAETTKLKQELNVAKTATATLERRLTKSTDLVKELKTAAATAKREFKKELKEAVANAVASAATVDLSTSKRGNSATADKKLAAAKLAQTTAEKTAAAARAKVDEAEKQTSGLRLAVTDLTRDNDRLKTERGELEAKLKEQTGLAERMRADLHRQTSGRNSAACAASSAESSSSSSDSDSESGQQQAEAAAVAVVQAGMLTSFSCQARSMYEANVATLGANAAGIIFKESEAKFKEADHARAVALASSGKRHEKKSKGKRKKGSKKSKKSRR
jgi:hypothetical protein